ncbi:MAG: PQQ-dependent sugar dehydrogenase [Woeseia sp.]
MTVTGKSCGLAVIGLLLAGGCGGGSSSTITNPPTTPPPQNEGIALEPVFDNLSFNAPVALLQAPGDDSRWFVVEQAGVIRVFDADPNVAASTVFADIEARVDDGPGEAGLLGMAFHPDFELNGEVFLSYTRGGPLESVVSRFTLDPADGTLDESSEDILLTALQDAGNHNGGNLAFGPDRNLYIGFGDGGGSGDPNNRGQTTSNYLGAIVRIDVDGNPPYGIPASNPFAGNTECMQGFGNAPCPEIYAFGFRNPWRFSFDSQTGQLWVGDVGQGDWEEVNRVEAGLNYGWREREGAHCFDPPTNCSTNNVDPISEYGRALGTSVTGGYVYRGSAVPVLIAEYVFGDFISGRIFSVAAESPQGTTALERLDTSLSISSFGEGADGELYVLDYATGTIHQVISTP